MMLRVWIVILVIAVCLLLFVLAVGAQSPPGPNTRDMLVKEIGECTVEIIETRAALAQATAARQDLTKQLEALRSELHKQEPPPVQPEGNKP